jgi:hypothetical protein
MSTLLSVLKSEHLEADSISGFSSSLVQFDELDAAVQSS